MRKSLRHLSPSGLGLYLKGGWGEPDGAVAFYKRYLSDRSKDYTEPQTPAMCVGTGFDWYVKHVGLTDRVGQSDAAVEIEGKIRSGNTGFGVSVNVMDGLVEAGVSDGWKCYTRYRDSGLLGSLVAGLGDGGYEVEDRELSRVDSRSGPLIVGRPDLWVNGHMVLDWKVNGYYGHRKTYGPGGWVMRSGVRGIERNSRVITGNCGDWLVNQEAGYTLGDWWYQLVTYCWLTGARVAIVDQLCGPADDLTVYRHSKEITDRDVEGVLNAYRELWSKIVSGTVIPESKAKELDQGLGANSVLGIDISPFRQI